MSDTSRPQRRHDGAFPLIDGGSGRGFLTHALIAIAALAALNWLIVTYVPFAIRQIGSSYLIFFYHFPSAICMYVFYAVLCVASVVYLLTKDPVWDARARVAAGVGVLANAVVLVTGSAWAKAAWNAWWIWDDPRLMSAAITWLVYVGYVVLQRSVEDAEKRRTFAAVYGILAILNAALVHYAIRWFGEVSHPKQFSAMSDAEIVSVRWYGVLAFLVFYLLLYRWRYDREYVSEKLEAALQRVRRLEEREGAQP